MKKVFLQQFMESIKSIVPITLIVLIISVFLSKDSLITLIPAFLVASVLLTMGMTLFNIGVDISMLEIGTRIGNHLTKRRNIPFILILGFFIGFIITIAEPDLRVLASQVPSISSEILICAVGIGVGLFLLVATLRMLFQLNFSILLTICCFITFLIAFFTPGEFVPLAFDSGGVTTGPLSVPFIIALCAGLAFYRNDKKKKDDTFGMISFCSIGPIIVVLILGIIYNAKSGYSPYVIPKYTSIFDVFIKYFNSFPRFFWEVLLSLFPIVLFFLVYNILFLRLSKKEITKIFVGLIYTYLGLSIFLTGVNVGFMPMGYMVGNLLASYKWVLVPIAMILGYFIVSSEPAIGVLTENIEELTNGNIKRGVLNVSIGIAVSVATGLSIVRILTGISIWWFLLPGYLFALLMTPFVPQIFTAIAFDSGGVASGTMTATFLLPFAIGVAEALNKNVLTSAFGLIAIVATTPLITIQIVGLIYKIKTSHQIDYSDPVYNEEIIDY